MNSFPLIKTLSISGRLLSLAITGILWHVAYKYIYKKITVDSEDEFRNNDDYSDCYKVIRMKIPSYSKGGIIGKNGATIKRIQEKTKTTIKFLNKNTPVPENAEDKHSDWSLDLKNDENIDSFDIILIRGLTLRVMEAEKEIKSVIASIPVYSEESMVVDNRFIGKIIGKKGENIKRLKEAYKVQIDIDRNDTPQRNVIIRGITENISECKRDIIKTIDLMMKEGKLYNPHSEDYKRFNNPAAGSTSERYGEKSCQKMEVISKSQCVTYPGGLNDKIYIYISSVVDCNKFYAHIVGDDLKVLTSLTEEMTDYFSSKANNDDNNVNQIFKIGNIVAGYYEASHTWQRVKIIDIKEDGLFEVIFLDYGDSALLKPLELKSFEKCDHFLNLPFQALRLVTYGIQSINDTWSEEEIINFEKLTKVGHCYQLTAVLKLINGENFEVQLLDECNNIDIAQNLIDNGKALPKEY